LASGQILDKSNVIFVLVVKTTKVFTFVPGKCGTNTVCNYIEAIFSQQYKNKTNQINVLNDKSHQLRLQ